MSSRYAKVTPSKVTRVIRPFFLPVCGRSHGVRRAQYLPPHDRQRRTPVARTRTVRQVHHRLHEHIQVEMKREQCAECQLSVDDHQPADGEHNDLPETTG